MQSKTKKAKVSGASASTSKGESEMIPVSCFYLAALNSLKAINLQLSAKRFVSVRNFQGKQLVDIREYYTDDSGERKPGKKGES